MNSGSEAAQPEMNAESLHSYTEEYIKQVVEEQLKSHTTRSKRGKVDTQFELFTISLRILPEYSDKLDRLVQSAISIWNNREKTLDLSLKDTPYPLTQITRDPLTRTAIQMIVREFAYISGPLVEWIHKFSAIHEESRLTELQRLELRLRLTEIEAKYQTAKTVLANFADPAV